MLKVTQRAGFGIHQDAQAVAFQEDPRSVEFDGVTEWAQTASTAPGISSLFTIMVWAKWGPASANDFILQFKNNTGDEDRLDIRLDFFGIFNQIEFKLYDNAGVIKKHWQADNVTFDNSWHQIMWTQNGGGADANNIYIDGVEITGGDLTEQWDTAGATYADTARYMTLGANQAGGNITQLQYHSIAIWDTAVLSAAEVLSIYNGGAAAGVDLKTNFGGYASASNLIHWWRCGFTQTDAGMLDDHVGSYDIDATLTDITAAGDILTEAPTAGPVAEAFSLDFDGETEWLYTTTGTLGIANSWSVALWVNTDLLGASQHPVAIGDGVANQIRVSMTHDGRVYVQIKDSSNSTIKHYLYPTSITAAGGWYHICATWNGTALKFYEDGSVLGASLTPTDTTGTMTDTSRVVIAGGAYTTGGSEWNGQIHSIACWDTVLTAAAITEIYNSGVGNTVDLSVDGTNYLVSSNLQHWWRLGYDPNTLGKDYGNGTTIDMDNLNNITAEDNRVENAPDS